MANFFKKIFSKENLKRFFFSYIWLMVVIFVIDIVTKWAVVNHFGVDAMNYGVNTKSEMIQIIKDFLYIGGSINNKAAFSLGPNRIILMIISIVMSIVLIFIYIKYFKKINTATKIALALMISGAVGNLIDRAFYWPSTTGFDGVVDWIQVYFGNYPFAMFNIADSALVVGVVILLVVVIIDAIKEAIEKSKAGEYKYSPEELEKKNKEKENEANQDK